MSETIQKSWITDENGQKIAPKTLIEQVQDNDGTPLQNYVDRMILTDEEGESDIPEIKDDINGNAETASKIFSTNENPSSYTRYYITFHTDSTSENKSLKNNDGLSYFCREGDTLTPGTSRLILGNNIPSGTDGNKTGSIGLHGDGECCTNIQAGNPTDDRSIYFPDANGTVALTTSDSKDNTVTFTSNDAGPDGEYAVFSVDKLESGETHSSIFNKISKIFTNVRYILNLLGNNDISSIGDGTVTGGIKTLNDSLLDKTYPVGSIYMSVSNVNPSTLFGGTWVAWGSGRVPVGVNKSDSNFNTVEKTGGKSSNSYNFTHNHIVGESITNTNQVSGVCIVPTTNHTGSSTSGSSKLGSKSISTLQPYITCYMWKRTA